MGLFIISIIVSTVPCIIFYKWLKKAFNEDKYKELCKKALLKGMFAVLPIMLTSAILFIIGRIMHYFYPNELVYQMYYTIVVLAFSEELIKFILFKKLIKKNDYKYSMFNLTIIMTIIGIGFELIESITFSFGSNPITMLIRGITLGHVGYGFIMGYFYAKMLKTKKKRYGLLSFGLPWFLHGLYDFSLSDEFMALNDNLFIVALLLTLISIICVILVIIFVKKRRSDKKYIEEIK